MILAHPDDDLGARVEMRQGTDQLQSKLEPQEPNEGDSDAFSGCKAGRLEKLSQSMFLVR